MGSGGRAPAVLGGLDELEHHGQGSGWAAGGAGDGIPAGFWMDARGKYPSGSIGINEREFIWNSALNPGGKVVGLWK
ncbi:hypothetical protein ACFV6F_17710 [Kitasatospora phosalacinea]|uniref:hypothetical protein n=1 Tax=Kitasatospora phosalacinea TaxID=2065 RepID=UPI0036530306